MPPDPEKPAPPLPEREGAPNDRERYEISPAELPLHCPLPRMSLWNSHPRVFLPIEAGREARCPYCGAEFFLGKQ